MDLTQATELGALLFTNREIEIIINASPTDLKMAIVKGQLLTEAEVRKVVIDQAKAGSGEAQKLVQKWLTKIKMEQNK